MVNTVPVYRIVTFIPPERVEKVIRGVVKVTSLRYGNYDQVTWQSAEGIERFRPLNGSQPTAGKEGIVSLEKSIKLEFSVPRDNELLEKVIQEGIIPTHPWEEPVILIYEVRETRIQTSE